MKTKNLIQTTILLAAIIFFALACEREWNNPWDEKLNPQDWAPTNLEIEVNSITSVTLNWQDNSTGEEGFKIDRKINQGEWVVEFANINASQTNFTDNGLDLNNNVYYYRVYAFLNQYFSTKTEELISLKCGYPFIDNRDGQQYETVQIGDQCWMKENLNYETSNSWCYDNNSSNCDVYGRLYTWDASLNACPDGWHLPTDAEWCILEQEVDPTITCNSTGWRGVNGGTKLKQGGSSGFEALLAGNRSTSGSFGHLGSGAYFWSSSESGTNAWRRSLYVSYATVSRDGSNKSYGFSVRCIKDY